MAFVSLPAYSGATKVKKRRRGHVHGRYNGRGLKGEKSRGGRTHLPLLEGGQMPLVRRLPKRGFTNRRFAEKCDILNLSVLDSKFDAGAEISVEALVKKGIVKGKNKVKLLGNGKLTKNFKVLLENISEGAAKKITEAGGSVANQKKAAQKKSEKAPPVNASSLASVPK
ncbi:MAG: 50S ribosomal protein L15 [Elusimicrobia bacterium HGW-Elusimicrobia-2]|nr:MAG: 50S ribosomal protein L15 [Elusimicrobia bacterium HGW-Elusimicrobia-2]